MIFPRLNALAEGSVSIAVVPFAASATACMACMDHQVILQLIDPVKRHYLQTARVAKHEA